MHTEGPLLIIAGAGSGKTRTITHRIAHLVLEQNVRPYNIVAVTFTNKAAEEMRNRLESLLGRDAKDLFVRTFHSLGLYILLRNADSIGLKSNFTIYDASDQNSLLKKILKDFRIENDFLSAGFAAEAINRARDSIISPENYDVSSRAGEEIRKVYIEYIKRLRENNSLDFGDLLYESVKLFEKKPEILEQYRNLWKYCMIDEYQDTNFAQYRLGRLISETHKNIVVVGDDDQSIYSWRGADVSNILNFEKDYPNCKILRLEENYRSTPHILKAASSVIFNNSRRLEKTIFTRKEDGEKISCGIYENENEEASFIINKVRSFRSRGNKLSDMAIFYRTNAQSRIFEQYLQENRIPYVLVGSHRFYERKEIKDIIAYLSVVVNSQDAFSLERIINVPPRGMGEVSFRKLKEYSEKEGISLLDGLYKSSEEKSLRFSVKMEKLRQAFSIWQKMALDEIPPSQIAMDVLDRSGYREFLQNERTLEATGRLDNLDQLIDSIGDYEEKFYDTLSEFHETAGEITSGPSLADYLKKISLYTDHSEEGKGNQSGNKDCLQLMTLHNAKGLEFDTVFLTGLEEGYLPHFLSIEDGQVEEERRLFYVGITRARKELFLSAARYRKIFGSYQPRMLSRFLNEVEADVLEGNMDTGGASATGRDSFRESETSVREAGREVGRGGNSYPRAGDAISRKKNLGSAKLPRNSETYSKGDRVFHDKFGKGTVRFVENTVAGQKAGVQFDRMEQQKVFLVTYSPMKKL